MPVNAKTYNIAANPNIMMLWEDFREYIAKARREGRNPECAVECTDKGAAYRLKAELNTFRAAYRLKYKGKMAPDPEAPESGFEVPADGMYDHITIAIRMDDTESWWVIAKDRDHDVGRLSNFKIVGIE